MKLVFHIGTHKAATTSIQKFFKANIDIARSNGIYYPCTSPPLTSSEYAHHELPRLISNCSDRNTYKPLAKELAMKYLRDYDGQDIFIISSEGLHNLKTDEYFMRLQYFVDQINPNEIQVICYFRELIDFANSAIRQKIQSKDFVPKSFYKYINSYDQEIYGIADFWMRIGSLTFDLFQADCFYQGDVISDILFKLGGDQAVKNLAQHQDTKKENPSIGGLLVIAKVAWNAMGARVSYGKCSSLAKLSPDLQSPLWVPTSISRNLRSKSIRNRSLRQMIGPPQEKSFSQFKPAETKDELVGKIKDLLDSQEFCNLPRPGHECLIRTIDSLCFYD